MIINADYVLDFVAKYCKCQPHCVCVPNTEEVL